jgi:hypothetical protein
VASDICLARPLGALGAEVVKQRAAHGEGEAQFSQGYIFGTW